MIVQELAHAYIAAEAAYQRLIDREEAGEENAPLDPLYGDIVDRQRAALAALLDARSASAEDAAAKAGVLRSVLEQDIYEDGHLALATSLVADIAALNAKPVLG